MDLVPTRALCSGCFPHHASAIHNHICICGCVGGVEAITEQQAKDFEDRITAALERKTS